jgi:hypothetical protein
VAFQCACRSRVAGDLCRDAAHAGRHFLTFILRLWVQYGQHCWPHSTVHASPRRILLAWLGTIRDNVVSRFNSTLPKGTTRTREDLLDDAAELKGAGLSQVAAIVIEFAAAALPMDDMSFCRYMTSPHDPSYRPNIESWLRATRQRQAQRAEQRKRWAQPPRVKPRPGTGKTKPDRG